MFLSQNSAGAVQILANMSVEEKCEEAMLEAGALYLLTQFLDINSNDSNNNQQQQQQQQQQQHQRGYVENVCIAATRTLANLALNGKCGVVWCGVVWCG